MSSEPIKKFRQRLEKLRDEILRVINWKEGASEGGEALDEIDQANELIEREMGFVMSTNMRANLKEVEDALERIEQDKFGKCLRCGKDIPAKRLEVLPFARYCITCQEELEARSR